MECFYPRFSIIAFRLKISACTHSRNFSEMIKFPPLSEVLYSIASDLSRGTCLKINIGLTDASSRILADSLQHSPIESIEFHKRAAVLGSIYYEYSESESLIGDRLQMFHCTTSSTFESVLEFSKTQGRSFFLLVSIVRDRRTPAELVGLVNSLYSRAKRDIAPLFDALEI